MDVVTWRNTPPEIELPTGLTVKVERLTKQFIINRLHDPDITAARLVLGERITIKEALDNSLVFFSATQKMARKLLVDPKVGDLDDANNIRFSSMDIKDLVAIWNYFFALEV